MLKMALLDYAINEKCCSVGPRRTGHLPSLFKSSHPREFAIKGKKMLTDPGVSPAGGGEGTWPHVEFTEV